MIRLHWGVENGLHWTLDITFSEDACGVPTGHPPQKLALLQRQFSLNKFRRNYVKVLPVLA